VVLAEACQLVRLRIVKKGHVRPAPDFLSGLLGDIEHCYHRKKCIRDMKSADAPALHPFMAAHVFKSFECCFLLTVAHLRFVAPVVEYLPTVLACSKAVFVNPDDCTAPTKERTDFNRKRFFVAESVLSFLVFRSRTPRLTYLALMLMR